MKLKDIKLLKQKAPEELKAMLPGLTRQLQELKLKRQSAGEVKYKIAFIKTICNN